MLRLRHDDENGGGMPGASRSAAAEHHERTILANGFERVVG